MQIAPSIYSAYNVCHRQAWLLSRQITADQDNEYLDIGRLISEESYAREKREIYIPDLNAKIDMVSKKNGHYFIAEVKKSSATFSFGIEQLKYYMYLMRKKM